MANIILIGFMGSGKSTVGRLLAERMSLGFVDSDVEIEKEEGQTISEMFEQKGEAYFRKLENNYLKNFSKSDVVLSTGGGMPCTEENLILSKSLGDVVYLKLSGLQVFNRLKNRRNNRPLVSDSEESQLLIEIENRLDKREGFYGQADVVVDASQVPDDVVNQILQKLNQRD